MPDPEELACNEFVEIVTDYLDDALDPQSRQRFEAHIAECEGCEVYLEQIRTTITTAGRLDERTLAPETRDAMLALFRDWASPG